MSQPALVAPDKNSAVFDSLDAAADAVSKNYGQGDPGAEQAAIVFRRPDGRYVVSNTAPQSGDSFAVRVQRPQGYRIAAIVHSHPGKDALGQVFSSQDLDVADKLQVPSYIRFLKDGSLRRYTPGHTRTSWLRMGGGLDGARTTAGDPVQLPGSVQPVTDSGNAAPSASAVSHTVRPSSAGTPASPPVVQVEGHQMTSIAAPYDGDPQLTPGLSSSGSSASGAASGSPRVPSAPTVPSLDSLKTTNPGASTFDAASAGSAPQATASTSGLLSQAKAQSAQSRDYSAGQLGSNDSTNVEAQLNSITNENNPYIQQARQQGMLAAASRGLQNSSLAAGNSEAAAVQAALPIASQNATEASQAAEQNAQLGTAVNEQNAQLGTQASEFNASEDASNKQLNAELQTQTSDANAQLAAQTAQFNASQKQAADATNAQAKNQMAAQTQALNEDINKQFLSGTQAEDLASIQGQYNQLIASNQTAANLYQAYFQGIQATMANDKIAPDRVAQTIQAQQAMLKSGLEVIDALNGTSLDITMPEQAPGTSAIPLAVGSGGVTVGGAPSGAGASQGSSAPPPGMPSEFQQQTIAPAGRGYYSGVYLPQSFWSSSAGVTPG